MCAAIFASHFIPLTHLALSSFTARGAYLQIKLALWVAFRAAPWTPSFKVTCCSGALYTIKSYLFTWSRCQAPKSYNSARPLPHISIAAESNSPVHSANCDLSVQSSRHASLHQTPQTTQLSRGHSARRTHSSSIPWGRVGYVPSQLNSKYHLSIFSMPFIPTPRGRHRKYYRALQY
jgi:hypothetical protein